MACLDVAYAGVTGCAACVLAVDWKDAQPARELTVPIHGVEPYVSGQFFKRELPALLRALEAAAVVPDCIVIDGYVWLNDDGRQGLGTHLWEHFGKSVPVVGVAKKAFAGNAAAVAVLRGVSRVPLFVTAAGMAAADAAEHVCGMHGAHRIPTLLKRVDTLCRAGLAP